MSATNFEERYAITFGEVAILHVGGKEIGSGIREHGFTVDDLRSIRDAVTKSGGTAELYDISGRLPDEHRSANEAATLVIRNGADLVCGQENAAGTLLEEQRGISYDRKFWNARQQKTMNKRARYNTTFSDSSVSPSPDYQTPSTHKFPEMLGKFRDGLVPILGDNAANLNAEGNHYFKPQSGIGFHGDAERKIVICLSLGGSSVLRYHWRMPGSSEHSSDALDVPIHHGDVYIMSEKATGFDWKSRSRFRVVHGAGSEKYIKAKKRKR